MRRIRYTEIAQDDLRSIFDWILASNPASADHVLDRIVTTIESLADIPTGRPGKKPGTYEKLVKGMPYFVAYTLDPDDDVLTVLYVQHMARDVRG